MMPEARFLTHEERASLPTLHHSRWWGFSSTELLHHLESPAVAGGLDDDLATLVMMVVSGGVDMAVVDVYGLARVAAVAAAGVRILGHPMADWLTTMVVPMDVEVGVDGLAAGGVASETIVVAASLGGAEGKEGEGTNRTEKHNEFFHGRMILLTLDFDASPTNFVRAFGKLLPVTRRGDSYKESLQTLERRNAKQRNSQRREGYWIEKSRRRYAHSSAREAWSNATLVSEVSFVFHVAR
jgi:hypothetical protein